MGKSTHLCVVAGVNKECRSLASLYKFLPLSKKILNHFLVVRNAYLSLHDLNSFSLSQNLQLVLGNQYTVLIFNNIKLVCCSEGGVAAMSLMANEVTG